MRVSSRTLIAAAALALACTACDNRFRRVNAPPQGESDRPSDLQPFFANMVDNSMLSDMSMADIHFVPHTTELNGTGTTRLDRMAQLLKTYGGTVHYETDATDAKLINDRVAHIREYLATTGIEMKGVTVAAGRSGGLGLPAKEAITIVHEGTVDKLKASRSQSSGATGAAAAADSGAKMGE